MEVLHCGCVYSKASLSGLKECWYCIDISAGKATTSCWDYKVHRGIIYNPVTGKFRTRTAKEQKGRWD